jgi:thiamine phosphate synthase YjbQ (UPF0047 family)
MRSRTEKIACSPGPQGLIDLTDRVRSLAQTTGVQSGRVTVSVAGADASLFLNENETGLRLDLQNAIDRAHQIASPETMGAASLMIPVVEGDLWLGAWQRVLALVRGDASELQTTVQIFGR